MTDNFENKVAVDGPVVNEGELGSSTFSPGQVSPAGPLGLGQRWTVTRKREVALRLLRGEPENLHAQLPRQKWTHPGKVEAPYTVCIASASNLTGLVKSSVECRRTGL